MTTGIDRSTRRPRRALLAGVAGGLLVLGSYAGCSTPGAGGRSVDPAPPLSGSGAPAPVPSERSPSVPVPPTVTAVAGEPQREVSWRLVESVGSTLLLQVQVGGPPCDAVTGVDLDESSPRTVLLTVLAGRVAGTPRAECADVAATLGTARLRVELARPLGARSIRAGARP